MFAELTGDASSGPGTLAAAILACASLAGTVITVVWGSKRKERRRTDVADTPPDVLANAKRLTTVEENLATLYREHVTTRAVVEAQHEEDQQRFKRIEDRIWPPTN